MGKISKLYALLNFVDGRERLVAKRVSQKTGLPENKVYEGLVKVSDLLNGGSNRSQ